MVVREKQRTVNQRRGNRDTWIHEGTSSAPITKSNATQYPYHQHTWQGRCRGNPRILLLTQPHQWTLVVQTISVLESTVAPLAHLGQQLGSELIVL